MPLVNRFKFFASAFLLLSARADITYTLQFDPASSAAAQQVANSVAVVSAFYNANGSFNKHWNVYYDSGIPTAQASYDGYMGFGGSRNERVVFHEASHTFGMGTGPNYATLISGGLWKGKYGNQAEIDSYNDYADGLHGDGHAVWPSGFNYDNEDGYLQRFWHTRIMAALRVDMGILAYTRELRNQAIVTGGTTVMKVISPTATSFQWYKNNVAVTNTGHYSGANSASLKITNADSTDAGSYYCAATGAGETLNSRARQLWVNATQLGQWNFNNNANDSIGTNHGTAYGSPVYTTGKISQAVDLDGVDDYIDLPDAMGQVSETTIAAWVNWDGGGNWQRVFDFGSGTYQNFFLCPQTSGGLMRLAFKDSILGKNVEYQVNTTALTTGQWVHLAAVMRGTYMTLYVNGKPVGSTFNMDGNMAQFPATNNYIGKSQYADPLFNGRVDDFRIYGKALNGQEIWSLWGQSANAAPVFSSTSISLPNANVLTNYAAQSISSYATDANNDALTFTKLSGPAWLSLSASGVFTGQPGAGDNGENIFIVRVTDPSGASSDATVRVSVFAPQAAPISASLTAPSIDSDDAYFFSGSTTELNTIDGTANSPDNDESTFVAENRTSKGQTFTTGTNAQGYFMQSFTVQHLNWSSYTGTGAYYDVQNGDTFEIQIGTMNGTTKTPLKTYTAAYDGVAITGAGTTSGTSNYFTVNTSALGIKLPPSTVCYFEIAPLTGDAYFELNSLRTGTYAGGTAFRGNVTGTLGTSVTTLTGDFIFHVDLEAKTPSVATTVAYWNFEEGSSTNTYVPYTRTSAGNYQGSIFDVSGNANHLSVWTNNWQWYRSTLPATTTPQTGLTNSLSIQNAGSYPAISATDTSLTSWSPTSWTMEATIRPDDATNGYQTFLGRDSVGGTASNVALAALYYTIRPDGALQIAFLDAAGNFWNFASAVNVMQDAKWHAVAATSDGSTVKLYVKNLTNGDANYTLVATGNISSSTNPALSTGVGDGADWDPGVFTLGRGLYNGGHTDRFYGFIDDVRLSNTALPTTQFLYSKMSYTTWINNYPNVGTQTNIAQDSDGDGLANGIENFFGTNPSTTSKGISLVVKNPTALTSRHPQSTTVASDLTATYQWSRDLTTWYNSGTTNTGTTITFVPNLNTPTTGTTTVNANITGTSPSKVFVRVQVSGP